MSIVLPKHLLSNFEEHIRSAPWILENIPEERLREEGVKRAIAAARRLTLVSPDEVQQRVVEEAEKLRELMPQITQLVDLVSRAMTLSMLLILLAALKELRDGEHGGDVAESISLDIMHEVEWAQKNEVSLDELRSALDERIEEIMRVFGG